MAGLLGLGAAAALALAALASGIFAIRQPVGFAMFLGLLVGFVCGALALLLLVLTVGYFRLTYRFEPGGLKITWLGRQDVIAYDKVDGIFSGQRLGQTMRVRGLNWPGFHVGVGRTRAMGFVRYFVTTGDLGQIALIVTPDVTFALSPADPAGFRRELIARVEASDEGLAVTAVGEAEEVGPTPSPLRDITLFATILASIAVLVVTALYISARWASIPDVLAMQFARDGTVLSYGQREDIFRLPGIGAAILVANLGIGLAIYARERTAARMLWSISVIVQVLVLVATARILH
ncbi:MAG: PH domain-containing protein [Chloroflexota bacterium]